ncbi:putative tricarboxylic transport membrane protein [Desulfotomaculum arcticum]|uniref:Putative tricarboxylic transport membrane protein n=1 Tax=Desulfotruncus arcticus DSM 17038 TaxID=1121424 RepID=A0A1I2PGZ2_9FIRM|nr:tripartite tricarboxylate transporter permease [Desulfotruncus arcticus]SFG14723.1 putative tricarboxylic transport membrane protein [Desulfotomaculum arcticum] [Desulfotruncus arcticus DSM 17038]
MDGFEQLLHGFAIAGTPVNLLYALLGVSVGTLIGVLPGVGPVTGIALLLPLTFGLNPVSALIMLAGIYYGAMYGGAITSILTSIPGDNPAVITALEGHQLAKKGRASLAMGVAAISSFTAGTIGLILLVLLAPIIAQVAIRFGPPEYFSLMLLSFTLVAALSTNNLIKGLIATVLGLLISTVGIDIMSGEPRFTFGLIGLLDGIDFIIVAIGLFALSEVLISLEHKAPPIQRLTNFRLREMIPSRAEFKRCIGAILRGTGLGFVVGILPGAGASIATFLDYGMEKSISKHPEDFGTGVIEAVAGAESSNNAAADGSLVALLTLGIPGSGSTAVLLGGFMLLGIAPGPTLFTQHPDVVWGLIASMYLGNVMLLVMNLPMVSVFVQVLRVPYPVLSLGIIIFSVLGVYSVGNNIFQLWLLVFFGVLGYVLRKLDFPLAPLLLGVVLGKIMEKSFLQSLLLSEGKWQIFFQRPISLTLLIALGIVLVFQLVQIARRSAYAGGK